LSADDGAAVQASLRALGGSLASVTVARTATTETGTADDDSDLEGWVFSITFPSSEGNVEAFSGDTLLMSADSTSPTVAVDKIVTGTDREVQVVTTSTDSGSLSGNWFLAFDGEETNNLESGATYYQVETALEGLTGVGDVSVSRTDNGNGGYSWSITFNSPDYDSATGELPLLYAGGADSASTVEMLTSSSGTASVTVERVTSGSLEPISGSLTVEFDGVSTEVAVDASADDMAMAINSLGKAGLVSVTRSTVSTAHHTYVWTVTFLEMGGDVAELDVTSANLSSSGVISVEVDETNTGMGGSGLSGDFYLE
jgi:hypothetical protein